MPASDATTEVWGACRLCARCVPCDRPRRRTLIVDAGGRSYGTFPVACLAGLPIADVYGPDALHRCIAFEPATDADRRLLSAHHRGDHG